ncbi:hypothetical protein [Treponema sp. C6A8]|uniref:NADase-type glycan-binding domain-containing protein n=1 Tax=Treponema sp. C6A8 TaxID=1410609 RepID=UPI0004882605|nr:hypothetical protein [Treponema sp. C6A8]
MKKNILLLVGATLTLQNAFSQSNWFMAQTKVAKVKSVVATSELVEAQYEGKYLYPPINILDGNFENTWCEAEQNGPGIGESITIEFSEPVSFDEIQIVNGFATKDYYKKNNRVKTIVLTQVAKKHFQQKEYTLKDDIADWQSIKFDLDQTAQTITIKITDVYKGTKYDDTCLDDIRLLYKGKVIPFMCIEELKTIQEENSKQMLKSTAADFKNQFFALFDGGDKIYLKPQKGNDLIMTVEKDGDRLSDVSFAGRLVKFGSKESIIEELSDFYDKYYYIYDDKGDDGPVLQGFDYEKAEAANPQYLLMGGRFSGWGESPSYSLGNYRILKTETISYVKTTTAIIIKLDGSTVYWNGVPYTVLTDKQVYDVRFWDGP